LSFDKGAVVYEIFKNFGINKNNYRFYWRDFFNTDLRAGNQ
jgi:hypothetical protein